MSRITLIGRGNPIQFECNGNENLLEAMIGQGIYLSAYCSGRGTCGKCRVQLLEGELEITSFDRAKSTDLEIKQGYRLSCKVYPRENCTIRLATGTEADFEIITIHDQNLNRDMNTNHDQNSEHDQNMNHTQNTFHPERMVEDYAIAIDIGTTTIAISLIELSSKNLLHTHTTINRQRAYGADVISRMKASNDGKREILRDSIRKDLFEGIQGVIEKANIPKHRIQKIAIAGNTTMGHLLMGYSCQTLGSYPFTPVNIGTIVIPFEEVIGNDYLHIPVTILPGISTYVGGDIVAGLLSCEFDRIDKPCLLIDLGTNGEMAIGNKDRILVSSAAAGPAFEGGNISCGVGSIAGAICNIDIEKDKLSVQMIGQKPPIGICGTGVVALISELVKSELVDATGLLCEEYFEEGFPIAKNSEGNTILFTQKDIREFQLAKAAIRAGAETLILRYGITYNEIDTVYLAGGFGYKIDLEKAMNIGLLPKELSGKIKAIGNSALGGAIKYLAEVEAPERIAHMIKETEEISLSNDKDFGELYLHHMFLKERPSD